MKEILITLLLLAAVPCFGQVNVEDQRLGRKETGFSGSARLSLEIERGNSELTEAKLDPRFVYRLNRSQWFILNSYSFAETDEGRFINEGFTHFRYNYDLSRTVVLEALLQTQYDREQDLRRRYLAGAGFRFELMGKKKMALAIGVTGMYEHEELIDGTIIETPRNSDYMALRLSGNEYSTLSNTVYFQPAFDDIGDVRVLNNLELSLALSKWLALTTSMEYRYDSEPPAGVKEYDISLKNGVTVKF